ncbi:sensor histidine kinase [Liquorilactobacillus satsumensis]|uniref:histidine kinase n=1 Tax=Liquorilactobacillus satsumensis DSM 16230 = JCM 12392 TaxID=1423801 RepID=A0A0R1UV74_9LACO|nr:HAMP domain-containing sensor histidine kinase [Liquorilactobacillus satsumensis]KRL96982.1 sensor histidine kinase [Liquorilactobacillus satsumensis DSM 16230 = JCM 12392]MCC7667153.1 sensor histidine kinase [Liquorilactobacillus satsumensis]MCP9357746.1 HAMP domain-containing histidine kinase [Liquorilactobacillus satsumensis]MCP9371488.1 HAMP domain-containing histidine kinase [Liquorilactobacillus satsumensis]
MIQKFRYRFIGLSTAALFIVLLTVIGSIIGISAYRAKQQINNVLIILSQNDGQINSQINTQNVKKRFGPSFNQESLYQYRYFSVSFDKKGKQTALDDTHIISISRDTIMDLGRRVYRSGRKDGTIRSVMSNYSYKVTHKHGKTNIVFLDESVIMESTNNIMEIGLFLGAISLLLFTLILIAFSKRAIKPIVQAEKRQKEFITNAGHELKTPLSIIKANTELQELMNGKSEWTTSNEQQVDRLTRLINNLISLARMEEQPKVTLTTIDASATFKRATDSFKAIIMQEDKTFKVKVMPGLKIRADENSFYELCNILLDNANKYCDDKGTVTAYLTTDKRQRRVTLLVGNTYVAGKNSNYSRFFERFYRDDKSHNSQKKGFGIGLSMAQSLIATFKAKLSVRYRDDQLFFSVSFKPVK